MARFTVHLSEELVSNIRRQAAHEGQTLSIWVERMLGRMLAANNNKPRRRRTVATIVKPRKPQ